MRIHLTTQGTAYICAGIIIVASIASMLVIHHGVATARRSLYLITEIGLVIADADYKMETNAIGTGNGVLAYLDTGQSSYREEALKTPRSLRGFTTILMMFDEHIHVLSAKDLTLSTDDAKRALDRIAVMSGVGLPLSLILSASSVLVMLKVTRRPTKAIKERAATLVAGGGLCKRLSVRSDDEFCSLAEHFNLLLDQVESTTVSKDKLEQVNLELRKEIVGRKTMQKALGKLSRKLIETQENERRHIARELHDHIGQSLTALKINIDSLQATPARDASIDKDNLAIVVDMLSQLRSLSLDLRPPLLDDLGLAPALRWHLDQQAQRSGFTIEFIASPIEPRPSRDIENTCFRIAQEALTNISRHARASHVRVTLERSDENLALIVHDDGIGFDVAAARQLAMQGISLGLLGMEERAQLIGGHTLFASAPGIGTEIRVLLPMVIQE